jgi:predicted transposase YdaD
MGTWEQQTEQRGLERGLQQGLRYERSLILKLLTRKIGPLSAVERSQVEALSREQLEALAEVLLDIEALSDLTTWLEANKVRAR